MYGHAASRTQRETVRREQSALQSTTAVQAGSPLPAGVAERWSRRPIRIQRVRLPMEHVIIRDSSTMQRQKERAAHKSHHRGDDHSPTQEIPDEKLHVLVAPAAGAPQRLTHMPPRRPLYAISTARNTITTVNTVRSARTLAPARTRAPVRAPASTPSMTGNASTGSIYPRWR